MKKYYLAILFFCISFSVFAQVSFDSVLLNSTKENVKKLIPQNRCLFYEEGEGWIELETSFTFYGILGNHADIGFENNMFSSAWLQMNLDNDDSNYTKLKSIITNIAKTQHMTFYVSEKEIGVSYISFDQNNNQIEISDTDYKRNGFDIRISNKLSKASLPLDVVDYIIKYGNKLSLNDELDFSYGNIPFGESLESLVCSIKNQTGETPNIKECNGIVYLPELYHFNISILESGLSCNKSAFNGKQEYRYKYPIIKRVEFNNMELYFVRSFNEDDYTLMMVISTTEEPKDLPPSMLKQYYKKLCSTIQTKLGTIIPQEFSSSWDKNMDSLWSIWHYSGFAANWNTPTEKIYLLTSSLDNTTYSKVQPGILIYLNSKQEEKFNTACADFYNDSEKKNSDNLDDLTSNFRF